MQFDISKIHLHICIPCYGGQITEACFKSVLNFGVTSMRVGLAWTLDTLANESLVTRARNSLVARMLSNPYATHLMFIDADIRFEVDAIFKLLQADKDVVAGMYPMKVYPITCVLNGISEGISEGLLEEVTNIGTGFMLIKRPVLEKMMQAYSFTHYMNNIGLPQECEQYLYALFDVSLDNGHYLPEDWTFCKRWRDIGGKIWAHKGVILNHLGYHEFVGSDAFITSNKKRYA
jgi:hypothetical protein